MYTYTEAPFCIMISYKYVKIFTNMFRLST